MGKRQAQRNWALRLRERREARLLAIFGGVLALLRELPSDRDRAQMEAALRCHKLFVLQAATGSGNTMRLTVSVLAVLNAGLSKHMWFVVAVQQRAFVAEKMV